MHFDHAHEPVGGAGQNSARSVSQWQTPHLPEAKCPEPSDGEADIDLVEDAFIEAFPRTPDPTSFLRFTDVPLVGEAADGKRCCLLRVEISEKTDIGSLSPYLGGGHRHDPLPAKMVTRRETNPCITR